MAFFSLFNVKKERKRQFLLEDVSTRYCSTLMVNVQRTTHAVTLRNYCTSMLEMSLTRKCRAICKLKHECKRWGGFSSNTFIFWTFVSHTGLQLWTLDVHCQSFGLYLNRSSSHVQNIWGLYWFFYTLKPFVFNNNVTIKSYYFIFWMKCCWDCFILYRNVPRVCGNTWLSIVFFLFFSCQPWKDYQNDSWVIQECLLSE